MAWTANEDGAPSNDLRAKRYDDRHNGTAAETEPVTEEDFVDGEIDFDVASQLDEWGDDSDNDL